MKPAAIRVRVVAPRGTRVLVEVVEFDPPGLPPLTIETSGVSLPSEPPPAAPALRLVGGRRAA